MKKFLMLVAAAAMVLAVASPASAAAPGVAGTANCKGQTVAYLAEGNTLAGLRPAVGIGQVAKANNMSVAAVMEVVGAHCTPPPQQLRWSSPPEIHLFVPTTVRVDRSVSGRHHDGLRDAPVPPGRRVDLRSVLARRGRILVGRHRVRRGRARVPGNGQRELLQRAEHPAARDLRAASDHDPALSSRPSRPGSPVASGFRTGDEIRVALAEQVFFRACEGEDRPENRADRDDHDQCLGRGLGRDVFVEQEEAE